MNMRCDLEGQSERPGLTPNQAYKAPAKRLALTCCATVRSWPHCARDARLCRQTNNDGGGRGDTVVAVGNCRRSLAPPCVKARLMCRPIKGSASTLGWIQCSWRPCSEAALPDLGVAKHRGQFAVLAVGPAPCRIDGRRGPVAE